MRKRTLDGENDLKAVNHGKASKLAGLSRPTVVFPAVASKPVCRSEILAAYEKVLQRYTTPLNETAALPFPKEEIREAIREELAENPDNEFRNHLEMAFVHLESFVSRDEYQLVEEFKQLSSAAQRMAKSGDPRDVMESWRLVKQVSGDQAVKIFEMIAEKMRRRRDEVRSIGLPSSAR
jgi:hypothetical protein